MFITDNKGERIEVTELDSAIQQTEYFTAFLYNDNRFMIFDEATKKYWSDVLQKLKALRKCK